MNKRILRIMSFFALLAVFILWKNIGNHKNEVDYSYVMSKFDKMDKIIYFHEKLLYIFPSQESLIRRHLMKNISEQSQEIIYILTDKSCYAMFGFENTIPLFLGETLYKINFHLLPDDSYDFHYRNDTKSLIMGMKTSIQEARFNFQKLMEIYPKNKHELTTP